MGGPINPLRSMLRPAERRVEGVPIRVAGSEFAGVVSRSYLAVPYRANRAVGARLCGAFVGVCLAGRMDDFTSGLGHAK